MEVLRLPQHRPLLRAIRQDLARFGIVSGYSSRELTLLASS
jgi:hypothetical protein